VFPDLPSMYVVVMQVCDIANLCVLYDVVSTVIATFIKDYVHSSIAGCRPDLTPAFLSIY